MFANSKLKAENFQSLSQSLEQFFLTVGQQFWKENTISVLAIVKIKKNRETLNTISKLYLLLFEYSRTTVFVNDYILALSSEDYFRSSFVSWPIVQREKEREKREMATTTHIIA